MSALLRLCGPVAAVLLSLAAAAPVADAGPADEGAPVVEAVFGGSTVEAEAPISHYVVMLRILDEDGGRSYCSGTMLTETVVVTAKHCTLGTDIEVLFGVNGTAPDVPRRKVVEMWSASDAPDWDDLVGFVQITTDIALLRLEGPAPDSYRTMQISARPYTLEEIPEVVVAGFGAESFLWRTDTATGSARLRAAVIPRLPSIAEDVILRFDQTHGTGACVGDSGGPIFYPAKDGPLLLGVYSRVAGGTIVEPDQCRGNGMGVSVAAWADEIAWTIFRWEQETAQGRPASGPQ